MCDISLESTTIITLKRKRANEYPGIEFNNIFVKCFYYYETENNFVIYCFYSYYNGLDVSFL